MRALVILMAMITTVAAEPTVSRKPFGKMPDGTPVEIFTLKDADIEARIITYGGIVVSLKAPDRNGHSADIVLGYDSLEGYLGGNPAFLGAIIGRYANRLANGTFELAGKKYSLPKNDGENSLHGGTRGFDKVVWQAKQIANGVELTYVSKDGDQGYPGTLTATVRYTLRDNTLRVEYFAVTDAETVVNLTQHSYFNLAGQGNGDILGHQLKINASRFTPVDKTLIPTGKSAPVAGTPLDFRQATPIGQSINGDHAQLRFGRGYDHNWGLDHNIVLDAPSGKLTEAAELYDPRSGRVLQVWTTEPGIQFYSGNFLDGSITGKDGKVYGHRSGLCLETQHFPDSPNQPNFPSTVLKPGQRYHSVTEFRFSTRGTAKR
ncbi:MAG: aldose epimerase family protein [Candidatus Acidiferrales bacterium]